MDLTKKLGPLPVWAWGLILGVGGYIVYARSRSSTATGTTPTDSVLDPNAVDPNTGLTYGQEEDAALNANAAGGAALGGGSTGESSAQGTVPDLTGSGPEILTDPATIAGIIEQLLPSPAPPATTTASPDTTAAATSAPVATAHAPTVTATTHIAPAQTAQQTSNADVITYINGLLANGFKKVAGTTQQGGLAQTGTYTYTPPKGTTFHAGPTKVFVYGTSATGLHIRAAN